MPFNFIAGTADAVYREVMDLAALCQADEVMITTTLPNPIDRRRTLLAMAEQFGLVGLGALSVVPFLAKGSRRGEN